MYCTTDRTPPCRHLALPASSRAAASAARSDDDVTPRSAAYQFVRVVYCYYYVLLLLLLLLYTILFRLQTAVPHRRFILFICFLFFFSVSHLETKYDRYLRRVFVVQVSTANLWYTRDRPPRVVVVRPTRACSIPLVLVTPHCFARNRPADVVKRRRRECDFTMYTAISLA